MVQGSGVSGYVTYESMTHGDRNPLKRWLQNRRLDDAIDLIPDAAQAVVDFGGGDGVLTARLAARRPAVLVTCFEPEPIFCWEAEKRLRGTDRVSLVAREADIADNWAQAVVCCEVFEHLPDAQADAALDQIARMLAPGGVLIVGVPVEVGPPALAKGLFRLLRRPGALDARPDQIWRACLHRPHGPRFVADIAEGRPYHPLHIGFDHRALQSRLSSRFDLILARGSPWRALPATLNSEIYFVAKKR